MKKYFLILIVISFLTGWYFLAPRHRPEKSLDAFAKCLSDKEFVMYGADYCPYCQSAKTAFGESFKYVNYIECPKNPQECLSKNISGYPTWLGPGGKKLVGWKNLKELSKESDCSLDGAISSNNQGISAPGDKSH